MRAARAGVLAIAALAIGAASASALVVQLPNGRRVSYEPVRGLLPATVAAPQPAKSGGQLEYHGGPIMPSNNNYALYWDPTKSGAKPEGAYPAGFLSGINTYFEDLAADSGGSQSVESVATQYGDTAGEFANYKSKFAGALNDTDPYPENGCKAAPVCLTETQLEEEIAKYVKAHGLPTDLTHEYFLLTPPGVEDCSVTETECSAGVALLGMYCAYHSFMSVTGGVIVYANDPYNAGIEGCDSGEHPNEKPSDGVIQGGLSHEHNESITDPEINAWFAKNGQENGDKCRTENGTPLGKAPDGSNYNQVINKHEYWYQEEWSNEGSECKQRLAPSPPVVTKISPKKGPASGETPITIDGASFTGATAVKFGGKSAISFHVNSPASITAVSPPGTSGAVDVTVTTGVGTSPIVGGDRFTYATPTVTGVSPNSGIKAGGTPVTITGSGFALGGATQLLFGKAAAAGVNCTSSSSCTAVSPPSAKTTTVDVVGRVGKKGKKNPPADHFTYF